MTEKQYENLMFALSTIIALGKKQNAPRPVPGIEYDFVEQRAEKELEDAAKIIFQDLTGKPSDREKAIHIKSTQEVAREIEDEQRAIQIAEQARLEKEAEKARLEEEAKKKENEAEERLRNMPHVTDTDYLNGDRREE